GLGITNDPIGRATTPRVQTASGGLSDGTYYVAAAWTNSVGVEGACSMPVMIEVSGGSFQVQASPIAPNVKGWNVYVGTSPQRLTRQNDSPLGVDVPWTQPDALLDGRPAGTGQLPDYLLPVPRAIQRG